MPTINDYIRINPLDLNKNVAIGVAFPFDADGVFHQTFTQKEQIKSNLVNVLLTEKGERVNQPDFGVGLKKLLFEQEINEEGLKEEIHQQLQIYIPEITLEGVDTRLVRDEHKFFIKLTYRYNPSDEIDAVQLNFN